MKKGKQKGERERGDYSKGKIHLPETYSNILLDFKFSELIHYRPIKRNKTLNDSYTVYEVSSKNKVNFYFSRNIFTYLVFINICIVPIKVIPLKYNRLMPALF